MEEVQQQNIQLKREMDNLLLRVYNSRQDNFEISGLGYPLLAWHPYISERPPHTFLHVCILWIQEARLRLEDHICNDLGLQSVYQGDKRQTPH